MEERDYQLHQLMLELEGKDKIQDIQTRTLFNLNNIYYPDLIEYTVSCPACRTRVYQRMKKHWEMFIKNKYIK